MVYVVTYRLLLEQEGGCPGRALVPNQFQPVECCFYWHSQMSFEFSLSPQIQVKLPKIHQFQGTNPAQASVSSWKRGPPLSPRLLHHALEIVLCPVMELDSFFEFHQKLTQSPKVFIDFTEDIFGQGCGRGSGNRKSFILQKGKLTSCGRADIIIFKMPFHLFPACSCLLVVGPG